MGIIIWLIVGLLAGFIARALLPGDDSMGILGTLLLGLGGSLVGGFLGNLLLRRPFRHRSGRDHRLDHRGDNRAVDRPDDPGAHHLKRGLSPLAT